MGGARTANELIARLRRIFPAHFCCRDRLVVVQDQTARFRESLGERCRAGPDRAFRVKCRSVEAVWEGNFPVFRFLYYDFDLKKRFLRNGVCFHQHKVMAIAGCFGGRMRFPSWYRKIPIVRSEKQCEAAQRRRLRGDAECE